MPKDLRNIDNVQNAIFYQKKYTARKMANNFDVGIRDSEGQKMVEDKRSLKQKLSSRIFIADQYMKKHKKPGIFESEPEWLKSYNPKEIQEKSIDIKAKLRGLKKYGYDVSTEDKNLNKIRKQLGFKSGAWI